MRILLVLFVALLPAQAVASRLIEPHMHIVPGGAAGPRVAMTLDACSGGVDHRILDVLVADRIPATIFLTARWMKGNATTMQVLLAHPDLFELEDHGAHHIPAVIGKARPYGIAPAGTARAVIAEVMGGAASVKQATGHEPVWYRGATALYSADAIGLIGAQGMKVGGFSLNGDLGASATTAVADRRISAAVDGDVIIAHLNQPRRASGAGVAAGILDLKARGFGFVRLEDVGEIGQ